ncbi:integrase core domain-containing protein [Amycolatopsis sp. NPDC059090]|uniref:integrase core domain-containing protein n=1 Tax=Amycolatopsis sp. NPDC059090 TaxID=3346723 RepID=UPI00366E3B00
MAEAEVVASVVSRGDSYDNAMAEAFNSLLKGDLIHNPIARGRGWQSVSDVEIAVVEYVDWYNHRRVHGKRGRRTQPRPKPTTERHAAINPSSPPGLGDRQRDLRQTRGASIQTRIADRSLPRQIIPSPTGR